MDGGRRLGTLRTESLGSRDGYVECDAMVLHSNGIKVKGGLRW